MKQADTRSRGTGGAITAYRPGSIILRQWPSQATLYRVRVFALALSGFLALRVPIVSLRAPNVYRKDLIQEYLLGKAILSGIDPYTPVADLAARFLGPLPDQVWQHPTPHPPVAGLLAFPLALFTYPQAAGIWLVFELLCLVLSAYFVLAELAPPRARPLPVLTLAGCALVLPAFYQELAVGQLMIPLLLLLILSWRGLRRGQSTAAGVFLGLSLALKFVTWPVLLLLVARKDWKALGSAAGVAVGANLAALAVMGPGAIVTYYLKVLPHVGSLYRSAEFNISLNSIGWHLFAGMGSSAIYAVEAAPLVANPLAAAAISYLLPLGLLCGVVLLLRRARSWETSFSLLICVSVLVSPISWPHYQVLLGLPLSLAGYLLAALRFPRRQISVLALVLLLMSVTPHTLHMLMWRFSAQEIDWTRPFTVPTGAGFITLLPAVPVLVLLWLLWDLDRRAARRGSEAS